jgi:hypothetical protein
MLSPHLRVGLPNILPPGFVTNALHEFIFSMPAASPAHLISLGFIITNNAW